VVGPEIDRGAGLWHAFVHRGFLMQARRERMLCQENVKRSACGASQRGVGVGSQPGHSSPSRLAIVCGAKSVPKPTPSARCHPGFPHRCATEEALAGLSSAFIRLHLRLEHAEHGVAEGPLPPVPRGAGSRRVAADDRAVERGRLRGGSRPGGEPRPESQGRARGPRAAAHVPGGLRLPRQIAPAARVAEEHIMGQCRVR